MRVAPKVIVPVPVPVLSDVNCRKVLVVELSGATTLMLRNALKNRPNPLFQSSGALKLMSRPASIVKFPLLPTPSPVQWIALFRLTSLKDRSVKSLFEFQLITPLMLMSPAPGWPSSKVVSVTLVVSRLFEMVLAAVWSILRSDGSMIQLPALPLAAIVLTVAPAKLTFAPLVSTMPPLPPAPVARALSVPLAVTVPPSPPSRRITPPSDMALSALIAPDILMTLRTMLRAVAADSVTLPPEALIVPLLLTSAPPTSSLVGTATWRKLPPLRSSAIRSPEPSPTLPSGTVICPALATAPPSSATKPPAPVVIRPRLLTVADAPRPANARLPAMKSASVIPSVDATKPPRVSIVPLAVITMPLGFTR